MSAIQIILTAAGAGVALFNYTVFLIMSRKNALPWALAALICLTVPLLLCAFLGGVATRYFPVLYEALKWIYIALGLLYSTTFFAFSAYLLYPVKQTEDADVFVVFGCRTFGYTPSFALRKRLDRAYELLCGNPDSKAVLSGGRGDDETVSEAESMAAYLMSKGIPEDRLIKEDRSASTVENIEFSAALIKDAGLAGKKISAVSSDFHIKRIKKLINERGLEAGVAYAKTDDFLRLVQNLTREYMVWIRTVRT